MTAIITVTMNPALDVSFEVERMVAESKLRGSKLELNAGGGGINVARAAMRLGADVEAVWLGGGANGDRLVGLLRHEGVRQQRIATRDEARMSIHVEERATTDMYRFVLPGPTVAADELAAMLDHVSSRADASFVVLSGSLPPGAPVDFYAQLAKRAPRNARVILDTNGEPLGSGLADGVFLAKPNRNELGRLLGRQLSSIEDIIAAGRELISAQRVEVLAVSMAEQGLVLVTQAHAEHIPAPTVQMVSAVGAGDSTVAGIVVGLARGWSLPEAARLGVAAGSAAVLTAGSDPLLREDTERLYAEMQSVRPVGT